MENSRDQRRSKRQMATKDSGHETRSETVCDADFLAFMKNVEFADNPQTIDYFENLELRLVCWTDPRTVVYYQAKRLFALNLWKDSMVTCTSLFVTCSVVRHREMIWMSFSCRKCSKMLSE